MQEANELGLDLYSRGDWQGAIEAFEEALVHVPDEPTIGENLRKARQKFLEARALFAPSPAVETQKPAVTVRTFAIQRIKYRGEFHILTSDGRKLAGQNAAQVAIANGSKLITGPHGHVELTLPDGTLFTAGANSEVVLDEFVYSPAGSLQKGVVSVVRGLFRLVTGKTAPVRPDTLKVKLLVGDLGFRGTDCEMQVRPDGSGYIRLRSGKLEISGRRAGQAFGLDAGQMVTFTRDGTFSPPKAL